MFHKICCAYDGSRGAWLALEAGFQLAQEQMIPLHVLAVAEHGARYAATIDEYQWDQASAEEDAGQILAEAQRLAAGREIPIVGAVRVGHPARAIVRFLDEGQFDLLIIGHRGRSAIGGRFLGSTVDQVIEHAPYSVLAIRR